MDFERTRWRKELPVLVPGCHAMGMIGVIRSLGRAGYPVHACSPDPNALGLRSNYAAKASVCPSFDSGDLDQWVLDYVRNHSIKAIIPGGGIGPLTPFGRDHPNLFPTTNDLDVLDLVDSKYDLFSRLIAGSGELSANLPPCLLYEQGGAVPHDDELSALGFPLFFKVDGCHSLNVRGDAVKTARNVTEARSIFERLRLDYRKILVQGFVEGQGVGAFFVIWNGENKASFMHKRLHEVPHIGGASSFREGWRNEEILEDAERKLRHTEWQGVGMVEYRWDRTQGRFYLMEMNLRFWGSIHLALYSNVDFPTILLDNFHGHDTGKMRDERTGVRCRNTFPYEVQYVWSVLKDSGLRVRTKMKAILEFVLLTLNPTIYSDLSFPGDRRLYWIRLWRFLTTRA